MAYNSKSATKRRNQGSHPGSLSHSVQSVPSNATVSSSHSYAAAPPPATVPSNTHGPGAFFIPEHYMNSNSDIKVQYHFETTPAPPQTVYSTGYGVSQASYPYQQTGNPGAGASALWSVQTNPYAQTYPTMAPPFQPPPFGYPVEKKTEPPAPSMDLDYIEPSSADSPPGSPSPSVVDPSLADSRGQDRRPRDPHRKEIEAKAANKRKQAVKRLQHVLAARTRGLPENGQANQLHMAADQLEEDGILLAQLQKENGDLKKQVATVEAENISLKKEIQSLKGR